MSEWVILPPSQSVKSGEDLRREREAKVAELERRGSFARSASVGPCLSSVARDFIPSAYREHLYEEVPLPLPG
jgi:hypothetical protein